MSKTKAGRQKEFGTPQFYVDDFVPIGAKRDEVLMKKYEEIKCFREQVSA